MAKSVKQATGWLEQRRGRGAWQGDKKLTKLASIKINRVAASKDNSEYLAETYEGKRAAHKPAELSKFHSLTADLADIAVVWAAHPAS